MTDVVTGNINPNTADPIYPSHCVCLKQRSNTEMIAIDMNEETILTPYCFMFFDVMQDENC